MLLDETDLGKRVVVYDRPVGQGNGIVGTIISVYSRESCRVKTDTGREYDFDFSERKDDSFRPWLKFLAVE